MNAGPDTERGRGPVENSQQPSQPQQQPANVTIHRTAVDVLLDGMRGAVEGIRGTGTPPWEPPHTPMKARFAEFEERMRGEKDTKAVIESRTAGPGRARSPAGVSEQRGCRHHEPHPGSCPEQSRRHGRRHLRDAARRPLRRPSTQFNNALDHDRGFSAAYDKASNALAQYGESRTAVDAIIAKAPTPGARRKVRGNGRRRSARPRVKTPSSRDGKSKLDDITKQLAEIFQRAVEGVKSIFNRRRGRGGHGRPGPSPGMGPDPRHSHLTLAASRQPS